MRPHHWEGGEGWYLLLFGTPGMAELERIKDEKELERAFGETGEILVVKFTSEECGPCRQLGKVIKEYDPSHEGIKMVEVDVMVSTELAKRHGVRAIPTLFVFDKGG